jgi:diaminopimelate decarboxylase
VTRWGQDLARQLGRSLALLIEPGRYVVAEAGALLTQVTTLKRTRDRLFVGVDAGMHHLVRPTMYGSYHPVFAIAPRSGTPAPCTVVGPICESGDVLADERVMVPPAEGDLLVVSHAGAYGYSMASQYNLRGRPAEVLLEGDSARLARPRERYRDLVPRQTLRG